MTSTRRRFLNFLAATPLGARAAAEKVVADLSGIQLGLGGEPSLNPSPSPAEPFQQYALALKIPAARQALRDILIEGENSVFKLDPDIASKKSWSFNAKICFQKQRNVEWRLAQLGKDYYWNRLYKTANSFFGSLING